MILSERRKHMENGTDKTEKIANRNSYITKGHSVRWDVGRAYSFMSAIATYKLFDRFLIDSSTYLYFE